MDLTLFLYIKLMKDREIDLQDKVNKLGDVQAFNEVDKQGLILDKSVRKINYSKNKNETGEYFREFYAQLKKSHISSLNYFSNFILRRIGLTIGIFCLEGNPLFQLITV